VSTSLLFYVASLLIKSFN